MRVTHQLIKNSVLNNLQRNLENMGRFQNMLSSGKAINKPSDDPIKTARIMGFNSALDQIGQYKKNIQAAKSWTEITEYTLQGVSDVLQRARELAVAGANGALSDDARRAIAMEIEELTGVLLQLSNTSIEGRYIFAGFKTTAPPFVQDAAINYNGDTGVISWEVAPNVTIRGNIDGQEMFVQSQIFDFMNELAAALNGGDQAGIDQGIANITQAIDHVLDNRAALGAKINGMELIMDKYGMEELNFRALRSELEDIDFAEMMINYNVMENVYRASLASGARIIQPSLLDFLR